MNIRQIKPAEAEAYQELRLLGLQESPDAFGSSYGEEVHRPVEAVAERLGDPRNHVFGAYTLQGKLIGMITLRQEGHVKSLHKAYIYAMYVHPEHRYEGIGRALMEKAIKRANMLRLKQINLSVVNSNLAAVRLYNSCGFVQFGFEIDAFRIGEDFYDLTYMALELKNAKLTDAEPQN